MQVQGGGDKDRHEADVHMQSSLGKPTTQKGKGDSYVKSSDARQERKVEAAGGVLGLIWGI